MPRILSGEGTGETGRFDDGLATIPCSILQKQKTPLQFKDQVCNQMGETVPRQSGKSLAGLVPFDVVEVYGMQ